MKTIGDGWFGAGGRVFILVALSLAVTQAQCSDQPERRGVRAPLTVTTPLEYHNVPAAPVIDFGDLIRQAGATGVLDPNSIRITDLTTGENVPCALGDDLAYGDKGAVEWVIGDPTHNRYEVTFNVASKRPPAEPKAFTPPVGIGDLLRYNAGEPRPITLHYSARLVDLTGDGQADLAGCWNYAYRPGAPWDGVLCYPRVGKKGFRFADPARLRYASEADPTALNHFGHIYMSVDFADFDGDGRVDLVYARRGARAVQVFLNTGRRDAGGMPIFTPSSEISVSGWEACRAVDLNGDGALDLVINGSYVRNRNRDGWPFEADPPVALDAGRGAAFLDLDRDGRLDSVCLNGGPTTQPDGYRIAWRRNEGGDPPKFGKQQPAAGIDLDWCTMVSATRDGDQPGLLVQHNVYQNLSFFAHADSAAEAPRFALQDRAESLSAVLSLSDQAWPCACDWDADGDMDLLVGGGYGWPRIVINDGTRERPAFAEAKRIHANGEPIRIVRNQVLGEPHNWHDMGYPLPDFVDWDGDGLRDLMLPNETNRIVWYKNLGTAQAPRFGVRSQILCDGFPDSQEQKAQSARRANAADSNNGVYPFEKERPFLWRTGVAFADWNGDGLLDLVTHDGHSRHATLFVRHRDSGGVLRLRKEGVLKLADGRLVDDRIVARGSHWTESFRPVDWDGDGLTDLMYNLAGAHSGIQDDGSIYLLRNCGTKAEPVFEAPRTMRCFGAPIRITNHGPHPWAGDFDGDGKADLICCVEWSVYPLYRHAALMMNEPPSFEIGAAKPLKVEPNAAQQ